MGKRNKPILVYAKHNCQEIKVAQKLKRVAMDSYCHVSVLPCSGYSSDLQDVSPLPMSLTPTNSMEKMHFVTLTEMQRSGAGNQISKQ